MNKFARSLITEWRGLRLPPANETILIAVSGGADSVSLALGLAELHKTKILRHRFVVAHYNHRLRGGESDADAEFTAQLANRFGFEFVAGKSEKPLTDRGENLEQMARAARYEFLKAAAESLGAFAVLTAHTLSDQAETFLINLIRGSGAGGLGAIKPLRNLSENGAVLLVRPLINWATRETTESFCRESGISYRLDSMNDDLNFTRVRVRKILLPLLGEFNPRIIETLARTANILRDEKEAFEALSRDLPFQIGDEISLKSLKDFPAPVMRQLLRRWIAERRGDQRRLGLKHFAAVERLIFSAKSGREVELPGGGKIFKTGGRLAFKNSKVEKTPSDD